MQAPKDPQGGCLGVGNRDAGGQSAGGRRRGRVRALVGRAIGGRHSRLPATLWGSAPAASPGLQGETLFLQPQTLSLRIPCPTPSPQGSRDVSCLCESGPCGNKLPAHCRDTGPGRGSAYASANPCPGSGPYLSASTSLHHGGLTPQSHLLPAFFPFSTVLCLWCGFLWTHRSRPPSSSPPHPRGAQGPHASMRPSEWLLPSWLDDLPP